MPMAKRSCGIKEEKPVVRTATNAFAFSILVACMSPNSEAQVRPSATSSSATQVSAEMTKGRLNPAQSRPGDEVTLRLNEDVRSNGDVVLKKGTSITGIVRRVKQVEGKIEGKMDAGKRAQSIIEIDWIAPANQGNAARRLSIAIQSVSYLSPAMGQNQEEPAHREALGAGSIAASPARASGGLPSAVSTASASNVMRANAALLSMPSVVAADATTASALENGLGLSSSNGQLFMVGRGELITAGSTQSLDIFSRLNNDSVLTSSSRNFEISSGAQMQLLVGVQRR
jgi:hypothetical protein